MTRYTCCDELRRNAVAAHATLNGIDFLEVLDRDAPDFDLLGGSPRQRTLLLRLLKVPALALDADNVRIEGGERVRDIRIEWVGMANNPPAEPQTTPVERTFFTSLPEADHVLLVRTNSAGDYSLYRLLLQRAEDDARPPLNFDPRLAAVEFSFKVECPSDFDCKPQRLCDEPVASGQDINYLAKDYASFRRLILDRLSLLVPNWRERSAADLGVTLAELLAYTGDHLSYWQDAVATEAYLATARQRTSLRRHALLVDYALDEGSNARVWLQLILAGGVAQATISLAGMQFLSKQPLPSRIAPDSREYREALAAHPVFFEAMDPHGLLTPDTTSQITLYAAHHAMNFYTWSDQRCCLPEGSTRATLRGHFDTLIVGQVLIFEEVMGPNTGVAGDADPAHRHALRLTNVQYSDGPDALVDPLNNSEITEIEWAAEDALPFPLCISAQTDEDHGGVLIEDLSVARGNILLADHGLTLKDEALGSVPPARLRYPLDLAQDRCGLPVPEPLPPRYRPALQARPLTQAATVTKITEDAGRRETLRLRFDPEAPASLAFVWRKEDVRPSIALDSRFDTGTVILNEAWQPRRDLLNSDDEAPHFVVESEHDGGAKLRFGDDHHGKRPESTTKFMATYRIGNGLAGNVGAEALAHVVTEDASLTGVRNPLAARGGSEPETAEQIRRRAPQAFRTQERAVTPEDYASRTQTYPGVQRAAAARRWTGSWHTQFITVDRTGGEPMNNLFELALVEHVEPYRMAGHDLEFNDPLYVSLEIDITVCVASGYFRSDVRAALLKILSNRDLPDGTRGLFHADGFSFGQTVYLSPIYAAARGVAGVESLEVTRFQRQGQDDMRHLSAGRMSLGRLEIPRLDNDPNFPEHGVLRLTLHGGK
jgi:hypothetical protein